MKLFLSTALLFLASTNLFADGLKPFTQQNFSDEFKSGKIVLLGFHSADDRSSARQKSVLHRILREKQFRGISGLSLDFEKEHEMKAAFLVSTPSTMILIRDGDSKEIARVTGITSPEAIRKILEEASRPSLFAEKARQ